MVLMMNSYGDDETISAVDDGIISEVDVNQ